MPICLGLSNNANARTAYRWCITYRLIFHQGFTPRRFNIIESDKNTRHHVIGRVL